MIDGEDYSNISVETIAARGNTDVATVKRWIRDDPSFPKPVMHAPQGDLYDRLSVYKWAVETGRLALDMVP